MKIKDRILLGIVSGLAGNVLKTALDELSLRLRISKRLFHTTAAGTWVNKKSQAESAPGRLLGGLVDLGVSSMGGVAAVYLLSATGRDHLLVKGLAGGIIYGSFITLALSAFPQNKLSPNDVPSNLSYMLSHAVYGLAATGAAAYLGHPSVFDTPPLEDYQAPTEQTTESSNRQARRQGQPVTMHVE